MLIVNFSSWTVINCSLIRGNSSSIFLLLIKNEKIPKLWLEKNILGLQNFNGGIEELSLKISQVRTWTYISNHQNWIDNTVKNVAVWFDVVDGWRFAYCLLHVHNNVSDNMDKDSSSTEPNTPTMCWQVYLGWQIILCHASMV